MSPAHRPRALLAGVQFTRRGGGASATGTSAPAASLAELAELARSAGAEVVASVLQRRERAEAATLIGRGKVDELRRAAAAGGAELVIFDAELSPTQQRNLEAALDTAVIDRTQLILDIFARHARTREGQLQVELAQLEFLLPRLSGHGAAMSRLGGGIGTRGPGETKLETDRRRIHVRIRSLREALERVRRQRGEQRRLRESVPLEMVALVGYTNAGKSTLFNRLTGAGVPTSARMFATLDPTIRILTLPSRRQVLLSDTVGFIRSLPHGLVSAFRATLEEVSRARLLLVVSDAGTHTLEREEQSAQVQRVLEELHAEGTPQIQVWNKADRLEGEERARAVAALSATTSAVLVSAHSGEGIEPLLAQIDRSLPDSSWEAAHVRIPQREFRLVHLLHERGQILTETHAPEWVELHARVPASLMARLRPYLVP